MLPVFRNQVKPWFEKYGATLDDGQSFRHMIRTARAEVGSLQSIMPAYEAAGFLDILAECERDIAEAEGVIALMEKRLAEIEA